MLVVIVILAILVGLILPGLNKAREAAKETDCRSKLHNCGLAVAMYLDDYKGVIPVAAAKPSLNLNNFPRIAAGEKYKKKLNDKVTRKNKIKSDDLKLGCQNFLT